LSIDTRTRCLYVIFIALISGRPYSQSVSPRWTLRVSAGQWRPSTVDHAVMGRLTDGTVYSRHDQDESGPSMC